MNRPRPVYFDDPPRPADRVNLAVIPTDGFTGAVVRGEVRVSIDGVIARPLVNGSGMLVFINLLDQQYQIEVDARGAGYFGPQTVSFTPPAANLPREQQEAGRRCEVILAPRPDFPFPSGTTVVRGLVHRDEAPVAGAAISARPDPNSTADFVTQTLPNGAFALALRLPPNGLDGAQQPLAVNLRFGDAVGHRVLTRTLRCGRSHSFLAPVDLADSGQPDFFTT